MYKKIIKSFLNLFLFSAIVHNCILLFLAIKTGNIKWINYFHILSLDYFWPKITQGWMSDVISLVLVIFIVIVFFIRQENRKRQTHQR